MRIEQCRELGVILASATRVGTNQARRPFGSELLVSWLAVHINKHECLAKVGAVVSPILGLVDAGKLLAGECSVVPFPVLILSDVVRGIADASPQLNAASVRVRLFRREETTEACTCVNELWEVGWGGAFAVDDARIIRV